MEIVIPPFDLKSISPIVSLSIAAIFILLLDVFCRKTFKDRLGVISFLVVIATGVVVYTQIGQNVYSFSNMFVVDNYSVFFNLVFLLSTALVILMSENYIKQEGVNYGEYYTLILFA
ncbi:MAG: NADH-quinone oxidoreductase subunit N, partial [Candidatus Scalindua sp.]|nr:NADH-quinone oxidoreductase subunit N [Candidatus Scalindua sp.]